MSIYKLIPSYLWVFTTWFHRQELSRFLFSCCLISSPLEGSRFPCCVLSYFSLVMENLKPSRRSVGNQSWLLHKKGDEWGSSLLGLAVCALAKYVAKLWENELLLPVWAKCKLSVRKAVTFNFQLLVNLFTTLLKPFHRRQVPVQADWNWTKTHIISNLISAHSDIFILIPVQGECEDISISWFYHCTDTWALLLTTRYLSKQKLNCWVNNIVYHSICYLLADPAFL